MKLLFKQRFFSWFDSYDIFDEAGNTVYTVEGQLSLGHCLHILDAGGKHLGTVKERVFTWLPKFEIWEEDRLVGEIRREFSFFRPHFTLDCLGWSVEGDWLEWDYDILGSDGRTVAAVSKQLWNWTDTYALDVARPEDALHVLMVALAIDAEKCSRS